jgi:hydrogenase expression/formation protein HypD
LSSGTNGSAVSPASLERAQAAPWLEEIRRLAGSLGREVRIMEVCGTHTVSIRRAGLRSLLPENVRLLSGPGCPVCVTPAGYIDLALSLLDQPDLVVATFGDMLKVPGASGSSLSSRMGSGRLRILYSPAELPALARAGARPVVFLGVGFETTAPTVAAAFLQAAREDIRNLYLFAAFKTVPPALRALLADPESRLDGFLLPGHVSAILGLEPYRFLEQPGGLPGAVTGFEPLDLLRGILDLLRQIAAGTHRIENSYPRVVRPRGNPRAREVLAELLEPEDALWRGLGPIPASGLRLRQPFRALDASARFDLPPVWNSEPPGCGCARVLLGRLEPEACPLFGRSCTPESPIGPCMVSSEGSCAAAFRYGEVRT